MARVRSSMRRLALWLLVAAIGKSAATADERTSEEARIRAALGSPIPGEIAWALHDASQRGLTGLGDAVRDVLERSLREEAAPFPELTRRAVDAALILDVDLSEDLVRRAFPRLDDERRVLLAARAPKAHRGVLRTLLREQGPTTLVGIAAGNRLIDLRDPWLAAWALERVSLAVHLTVEDPGTVDGPYSEEWNRYGDSDSDCGAEVGKPDLEGWPPRFGWVLDTDPTLPARLVAGGRTPVFARRREFVTGDVLVDPADSRLFGGEAETYLADLLGVEPVRLERTLSIRSTHAFLDVVAFQRAVERALDERRMTWLRLVGIALLRGVVPPSLAVRLHVPTARVRIDDERSVRTPRLPEGVAR